MRLPLCLAIATSFLILTPGASGAQVVLEWDASTDAEVTGYVLQYGERAGQYTSSIDVGLVTRWELELPPGHQRYHFVVRAYTASGQLSPPSQEVSTDALIVRAPSSFGARGPGIFWQHAVSGELYAWYMQAESVLDTRPLSIDRVADTGWRVAGTGDLNNDGHADIVWQHRDGWLAAWFLRDNQVIGTSYLDVDRMTDPNWQIKGVGDVNGDGFADLVWQHRDGWLAVWLMRSTTPIGTRYLSIERVSDPNWEVVGVTDTNGDGRADLLWRERTQGWLAVWYLDGWTVRGTRYLSIDRVADLNWRIASAGRLDDSGTAALVWRHVQGWVAVWYLDGHQVVGTRMLQPDRVSDPDWRIVGAR